MPTNHSCSICGRPLLSHQGFTTQDGIVCRDCYILENYTHCRNCGDYFRNPDHRSLCEKCEERVYTNNINSYGTKPRPYFKNFDNKLDGKDTGGRYYGMELEFNDTCASTVHELCKDLYDEKFIYNKSDASIGDGVEIVTSPMDRRVIPKFLERIKPIFDYVDKREYKRNAGLHIHVNKKTIDAIDRYKLNILLNVYNTEQEKSIIYFLSGRKPTIDSSINDHYFEVGSGRNMKYLYTGHNVALNTSNTHTYEFRIFKSTNNPDEILSYVELVDKMIDFCHENGLKDINTNNFIVYLKSNTSNKIILDKIQTFESSVKSFKYRSRIINTKIYTDKLRGLKWTEFYKVLSYMDSVHDIMDYCQAIDDFIDDYNSGNLKLNTRWLTRNCEFDKVRKLKETIRLVLVNRIKKQRKDNKKKCA